MLSWFLRSWDPLEGSSFSSWALRRQCYLRFSPFRAIIVRPSFGICADSVDTLEFLQNWWQIGSEKGMALRSHLFLLFFGMEGKRLSSKRNAARSGLSAKRGLEKGVLLSDWLHMRTTKRTRADVHALLVKRNEIPTCGKRSALDFQAFVGSEHMPVGDFEKNAQQAGAHVVWKQAVRQY